MTAARNLADPRRRLIAQIHIAPKQIGMDEGDYRALLRRVTGCSSSADMTIAQLEAVLAEFRRLGFSTQARTPVARAAHARPGLSRRPADHKVARKAQALWRSLGLLCAVRNPSPEALEVFVCRQLDCAVFQWANQSQGHKLIEALKAMAERHGWSQSLAKLDPVHHVFALKRGLADAILAKLKACAIVPGQWSLGKAAWELAGLGDPDEVRFDESELDRINKALGAILRARGGDAAFEQVRE